MFLSFDESEISFKIPSTHLNFLFLRKNAYNAYSEL